MVWLWVCWSICYFISHCDCIVVSHIVLSSQSWQRTKQKLRRRLSSIENRLAKVYKEDRQFSSHYFVTEADMRREDELLLPEEPAPEHVDLEEAEDRLLKEVQEGECDEEMEGRQATEKEEDKTKKKRKGLLINEEELERGRVSSLSTPMPEGNDTVGSHEKLFWYNWMRLGHTYNVSTTRRWFDTMPLNYNPMYILCKICAGGWG